MRSHFLQQQIQKLFPHFHTSTVIFFPAKMDFVSLEIVEDKARFRMKNQRVFLTYNNVNREWCLDSLRKFFIVRNHDRETTIEIAEQFHPDEGIHYYVAVDFGLPYDSRNRSIFDYNGIRPIIQKVKTINSWRSVLNRMSGVTEKEESIQKPPLTWCDKVDEIIETNDKEKINWIYYDGVITSINGYCQWLIHTLHKDLVCTPHVGTTKAFGTLISKKVSAGWTGKTFVMLLSKSDNKSKTLYKNLWYLLNCWQDSSDGGFDFSIKPTIVVISSWWPNYDEHSDLPWEFYKMIKTDKDITLNNLTANRIESNAKFSSDSSSNDK